MANVAQGARTTHAVDYGQSCVELMLSRCSWARPEAGRLVKFEKFRRRLTRARQASLTGGRSGLD